MTFPLELLTRYCEENGLTLPPRAIEQFARYGDFLLEYNEKVNLTAITEPTEVVTKHFIDSLSILALHQPAGTLLDVGSGAGFPGMPLLIARPELKVSLLDGHRKKLDFLAQLSTLLGVSPTLIHKRAEEAGQDKALREQFDTVTARAVASLNLLAEYCLPLVKVGGCLIAMKGPSAPEEVNEAKKSIQLMGGAVETCKELSLPDGGQRVIVIIKKIWQTPPQFPRPFAKISKSPL